ncbi:MAG: hypothetical protein ACR2FO_00170 [Actinomycetota bacterium]
MNNPRVFHDLMKTDNSGRLVLNLIGTRDDLKRQGIELREGLCLTFYSPDEDYAGERDDLVVEGVVRQDAASGEWVAEIDHKAFSGQKVTARGPEPSLGSQA